MAKSRAQRKAEAAKRRQQQLEKRARESQAKAQHDTQVPESGFAAEAEAVLEAGAAQASRPEPESAGVTAPDAPSEQGLTREERKAQRRKERLEAKERERRARESAERRAPKEERQAPVKERGRVMSFFASVLKELSRVQWPNRDTLVQASAVTLMFVAVAAAYLGVLDAIFSRMIELVI
jgi:preprotein translocase SecE subunit